jgi:hypothetical protein
MPLFRTGQKLQVWVAGEYLPATFVEYSGRSVKVNFESMGLQIVPLHFCRLAK